MSTGDGEVGGTPRGNVEVSFRQEWIEVASPANSAAIGLDGGIVVREEYLPSPTVHGVFVIIASKAASRACDVEAIHGELLKLMEDLRLVWYFAGGYPIRARAATNHESIRDRLFEVEHGHPRFSESLLISWNVIGPYRQMPLKDAVSLLRGLGRLPGGAGEPDEHRQVLWACMEALHAATVAAGPVEKFMRAFPALDLLATTHYGDPKASPPVKSVLRHIRRIIAKSSAILGARGVDALRSGLNVVALRDKFEVFVKDRLPQDTQVIAESFRSYNQLRNDVFHRARFGAVDADSAEATRQLLEKCLEAELGLILKETRRG